MLSIAIIAQKGGAGKTTLAAHLAGEAELCGRASLVIDTDPQCSAYQWGKWREGVPPEVIDCPPKLLADKIKAAKDMGAEVIIIDTPPHADQAAITAASNADLILVPCRPRALDLHAVELTAQLIGTLKRRAFVVFTGGNPNAPRLHEDAAAVVKGYGLDVAPCIMAERAAFHHAMGEGKLAHEFEPNGKAAKEIAALWDWASKQVG